MLNQNVDNELTNVIIGAFYKVYNTLGFGFLEKVYENAMKIELEKIGFKVETQKSIKVFYENQPIGEYFADLIVNDMIIIELKAAQKIVPEHEMQLFHYLKATNTELGLLLNFGLNPEVKRKIWTPLTSNPCESVQSVKSV